MTLSSHESQRSCICVLGVLINGLREVTVPSHESQRSFSCVLEVYINGLSEVDCAKA